MGKIKYAIFYLMASLGPLLFGILLVIPPLSEPVFLLTWCKQSLTFVANFLIFHLLILKALDLAPNLADLSRKNWRHISVIILLLILNLITLEAFRRYFTEESFAIALGLLTLRALAEMHWSGVKLSKAYPQRALLIEYLYWGTLASLGSYCFLGSWNPILIVMAFALSGATTSAILAIKYRAEQSRADNLIHRSFIMLAFSAPVIISLLVYGREVGPAYLAMFIPALLILKIQPSDFDQAPSTERWRWRACFYSLLFAAILLILNYT